ncbi:MAG: hypothetical protein FIA97_01495 [Methylococcaceae bacterium]|nr:hypothetical protein [Methylococcaceae bacterium]
MPTPHHRRIGRESISLMAILAGPQIMQAWRHDPNAPEARAYYGVPLGHRVQHAVYYIALAAFLAVMSHDVHQMLQGMHAGA